MVPLEKEDLIAQIKRLPTSSGVYVFKDAVGTIIYIGKAKNLRSRVKNYIQKGQEGFKASLIISESALLEHIPTASELEAMLLEAKLIQSHQPKHNIIFKAGQPFLYIMITSNKLPEITLVRNRKIKGSYFGPFIEKGPARKVYDFLIKTFRLKLCHKKVVGGCLAYHLGICSGSCRDNFDVNGYLDRLELAKQALRQGHKKFLMYLNDKIQQSNRALDFEKSREIHGYYKAFEQVFASLETNIAASQDLLGKDFWIISSDSKALFLCTEQHGVIKKKQVFYVPYLPANVETLLEYLISYYRLMPPAGTILINFDVVEEDRKNLEAFLQEWHKRSTKPTIIKPIDGHYAALMRMAIIQVDQLQKQKFSTGKLLKNLLELLHEPRIIDCFDISHKQGMFLVGSCVRFVDGEPAPAFFRKFKIKTVHQQDDYACLREVVSRRYHDESDFPDLILIDGGKGQLNAVQDLFPQIAFVSLAKREETIFSKHFMQGKILDITTHPAQVLVALRDYAHHFAISYHRELARKIIT